MSTENKSSRHSETGQPENRPTGKPFIRFENITVRIGDTWLLQGLNWTIQTGENWVIWGPNGAGKSTLAKALLGQVAVVQGRTHRYYPHGANDGPDAGAVALVSSDQQMDFHRHEQVLDQMRHFSGRVDEVTCAEAVLDTDGMRRHGIDTLLRLSPLLKKPLKVLSAGEMRRLLIGRALARNPRLLILDEPFNGLDADTREDLLHILDHLGEAGTRMVLITHRRNEIADAFSHLLHLDQGRAVWSGTVGQFFAHGHGEPVGSDKPPAAGKPPAAKACKPGGAAMIEMRGVNVSYGDAQVLSDVHWTVRSGENWAIVGPNGAGKSTLLKLITGDHQQGYANDLILFGRSRGSGESIWEIKQHIGYVADDLQIRYQKKMSGFDVVCSGFFDSVGLYRLTSDKQKRMARVWIERTGVVKLAEKMFSKLSFGQQRMLLIVRAMVKAPRLLILDEPCNGLDMHHRRMLLDMLDRIAGSGTTNLLYVSHRADEMPNCITHRLQLSGGEVIGER